ncbi:Translational repressor MPT5/PUF4 and related RNA-binding proteins (Puf superfamily) [Handroanthus impetiginosus]|uniref:Translational repressor MPT5/PUF4 and related RNA-binding proteins (Puf superfamily) n=1 Tax=Handroanthus impetiginosus TaxID=429701 RepID=A0A2G9HX70_9LAMI|nr:Translational repressor MPT5/PUF4 and related RNA-binding proteins (Puf superfamily) [Handroanthus impetiginosus]
MEEGIPQNPSSPASQPPLNLPHQYNNFLSTENDLEIPLVGNHGSTDQEIESAFSRLTISRTTPSRHLQETLNSIMPADSAPLALNFGEKSQAHGNHGGVNGPFGSLGPHQNINVGPETMDFFGRNPCIHPGDHELSLMRYHEKHNFWDASCADDRFSSLHGKKQLAREANNHVPIVSSSLQRNFCSLGCNNCNNFCSPLSSCYSNQHLYHQQQDLSLANVRGRIASLAKDKHWSGVLNLKLEEGLSTEEIDMILQEVMGFLSDLMKDQFGYQFVQKLFVVCSEIQRTWIILAITKFPFKLISICLNSYGSKAMQKLLEKLSTPQQIAVVMSALSLDAIALANDINGHHVIQYCVRNFPGEYNKHLFNEIAKNCFKIATNQSGCCVVQSCVEYSRGAAQERLLNVIIQNAVYLAENPYGNYVVQQLIGMGIQEVTTQLLRKCQGYFASFSCNKYASNVVEKFLEKSGERHCAVIIMELLSSPYASMLLVDPFGNFVIQKALPRATGHIREALINLIHVNVPSMKRNIYGRKILDWFEKRKHQNA